MARTSRYTYVSFSGSRGVDKLACGASTFLRHVAPHERHNDQKEKEKNLDIHNIL